MLIFEYSKAGRRATSQIIPDAEIKEIENNLDIPVEYLRNIPLDLPFVTEPQVVRHYTRLSQKNFSVDTNFYPLGSCTMKHNPHAANKIAAIPEFVQRHPFAQEESSQGFMQCLYDLQLMLAQITGMSKVSLCPMAGAQGEFVGVAMIRAYHLARGDTDRCEILIPDTAHGTNPASAAMCGYKIREIPTDVNGDIEIEVVKKYLGPQTAGLMLTNPSTLGVFDRNIATVVDLVHAAGGLLYYDGANLNAILGRVRPGDMGFDVMHLNLHKTFATPHGGGGPGAGPVAANNKLAPYLPIPMVEKRQQTYYWQTENECTKTIGRVTTCMGNAGVLLRAYTYLLMLGANGLRHVSEIAVLNANYLKQKLAAMGYTLAYPNRLAAHEFIITLSKQAKKYHINALDFAKRILDTGIHAPTIYFPLVVPECWLIEPTETETKETLDYFLLVMQQLLHELDVDPEQFKTAPRTLPVSRLDEVKAAKDLNVNCYSSVK